MCMSAINTFYSKRIHKTLSFFLSFFLTLLSSFSHQDLQSFLSTILVTLLQATAEIHQKQSKYSIPKPCSTLVKPSSSLSLQPCSYTPLCTIYHSQTQQPIIRIISCDISTPKSSSSNKLIQPPTPPTPTTPSLQQSYSKLTSYHRQLIFIILSSLHITICLSFITWLHFLHLLRILSSSNRKYSWSFRWNWLWYL